jgi:transcriptional regulator with XRE-family HTH domain
MIGTSLLRIEQGAIPMATLVELRKVAGLTQQELADRAGISWSQVQKLEYGQSRPSWQTLQGLAEALGPAVYEVEFTTPKTGRAGRPRKKLEQPPQEEIDL